MKKTSTTDPLNIDAINVPSTSGVIGMTLCPGKVQKSAASGEWDRDLELDLRTIQEWGASALVTLMRPYELKAFKVPNLAQKIPEGMAHFILPIDDGGVPDKAWEEKWTHTGSQIRTVLKGGSRVLIHCRGGLGRTGLVAARLLVEFGMEPEKAIKAVRKARPGTIENNAQEQYVRKQKAVEALPARPYHRISPDRASRFRGCLLGGAVGDALGAPVEFLDSEGIRKKFGPSGIRDLSPAYGRLGAITDDTQLTLFTGEGILRAHVRGMLRGLTTVPGVVAHAYQRWLITQGGHGKTKKVATDGWLFTQKALFSSRAPGNTCLSALRLYENIGDPGPAENQSKGCGGIMRVAPVGLYVAARSLPSSQAFEWGCEVAGITHGHPTGQLPAGVLSMLVCELVEGRGLRESIRMAKDLLCGHPNHEETLSAIETAENLASSPESSDVSLAKLGQGWVAEEALAISLFCALRAKTFEEGVITAVNITGDSDSTGSITGNLMGAMLGIHEIPERWLDQLELKETLTEMADDLATVHEWALSEFGHDSPEEEMEQEYWSRRYPGF